MRLDEDRLEALRRWGQRLQQADGEETAAAGRAILMLVEEIEQSQIDLRLVRGQLTRLESLSSEEAAENPEEPIARSLHGRLQRALRRGPDPYPRTTAQTEDEPGSDLESDRPATSQQAWIEELRRQT